MRASPGTARRAGRRRTRRLLVAAAAALALPLSLTTGLGGAAQAAEIDCAVEYTVNDWGSGFTAAVAVTNEGAEPVDGWTLTYDYSGNQQLSQGWNGTWTQSGQTVTVRNTSYNAAIAPGATVSSGANFSYSGDNQAPTSFALNGVQCGADGEQPARPTFAATPQHVAIAPGETAQVGVRLTGEPDAEITATVERTDGNTGLSVSEGASLTFTPSNWDTEQQVTLAADDSGSGTATFRISAPGHDPLEITATQIGGAAGAYEERFLEQYEKIMDPDNGYLSPEGIPYHSVETLMVEAPDHGHETTSEAYSYLIWLEAMYGKVTGDWAPFNESWELMETYMIPTSEDQPTNSFYSPSSPATYAPELDEPSQYPSELDSGVSVGSDPIADELSGTYGTDEIYGMHWLQDVDNVYGYGNSPGNCQAGPDDQGPSYINTFQRGAQESVWETVPQPTCDNFTYGGENGYLDLFTGDASYAQQWKFTNAPDADARAVQAAYWADKWAKEQGNGGQVATTVAKAAKMGDYLRYAMYDKYFKKIGGCTSPSCPAGTGKDSSHYLLNWYYAWGGALDSSAGWAWRIGSSHAHGGYQNPMAAYALSAYDPLVPESGTAGDDWAKSLDRQIEFYRWLQSDEGAIAGGATNSWKGRYAQPPAGTPTFHGMYYDEKPVYHDPPSNQWFGFQAWSMERVAEYYHQTEDPAAGEVVSKWVDWALSETTVSGDGEIRMPSTMSWSGAPDTWNAENPGANADLHVTVENYTNDVGVAAAYAKTLTYYAAASGDEEARTTAKGLLDAMEAHEDELGIAVPETRTDYERFDDPVHIPQGWTGQMPNGDEIDSDSTFTSIRSFYTADEAWPEVQEYLDGGEAPTFTYHRFWAQADIALALGAYAELFEE